MKVQPGGSSSTTPATYSNYGSFNTVAALIKVPEIAISGLASPIERGTNTSFEVGFANLDPDVDYTVKVSAGNSSFRLNSGCSLAQSAHTVNAAARASGIEITIYGCRIGTGALAATLLTGSTTVDTATAAVKVIAPILRATISDLPAESVGNQSIYIFIGANNLSTSRRYTLQATTEGGNLGFTAIDCSNNSRSHQIPSGSSSFGRATQLWLCGAGTGTVTVSVLYGQTEVASISKQITVT